jgi:signal transduction histidine kinase
MTTVYDIDIIPDNDQERVEALNRYQIFNTAAEPAFDRICELACTIFNCPIAHISFLDADTEFVKANMGVSGIERVERGVGMCAIAILDPEVTVIENALQDPLLYKHPYVHGEFGLRFYAGAPIITSDGFIIGTMCLVDTKPRSFTAHERIILQSLAKLVMEQTEMRLANMKLLQQKDDFISVASHELKTPLTSLKASLQLLDMEKDRPGSAMFQRMLHQANKSLGKLMNLVGNLLEVNRIVSKRLQLRKTNFRIAELIDSACEHIRIEGKHQLILSGDIGLEIIADENRIDQVVVNIVNNAIKYAPDSKEILITLEKEDSIAKVSITDYGPGISTEQMPQLFTRYDRSDYSGVQFSGLGLGLYISAEIIKQHGGDIGVESNRGKGSTFWFTLPL